MKRALGLLALIGCAGNPAAETKTAPARSPEDSLAWEVYRAAGGDRWSELSELSFRFVVERDGKRAGEVEHRWNIVGQKDRVRWTKDGESHELEVDLTVPRTKTDDSEVGYAYARWINDTYWLLLPVKVLDEGVIRRLEPPRVYKGVEYRVLHLSYDHVGLTPGDQYWLFIDPMGRIARWEMVLEGQEPPPRGYDFSDYRKIGPLELACDHVSDDGKARIFFEDVVAR